MDLSRRPENQESDGYHTALLAGAPFFDLLRGRDTADLSICAGLSGLALFAAHASNIHPSYRTTALHTLDTLLRGLSLNNPSSGLHEGAAGVAWTLAHLQREGLIANPIDLSGIDRLCAALAEEADAVGSYDLVRGLVGYGVYFLERLPASRAATGLLSVVDSLTRTAVSTRHGIAWLNSPSSLAKIQVDRGPNDWYDLGLAHGLAGVVGLLAAILRVGIGESRTRPLLLQAAHSLGHLAIETGSKGGTPPYISAEPGRQIPKAVHAWCYGDPGVGVALMMASDVLHDTNLAELGLTLVRRSARRLNSDEHPLDPWFCHGTSGLAHIFSRVSRRTGDKIIAAAAAHYGAITLGNWYGLTVNRVASADGPTCSRDSGLGLLDGISGVGLTLLSLAGEPSARWDRVLLTGYLDDITISTG